MRASLVLISAILLAQQSPKDLLDASGLALDRGDYAVAIQQASEAARQFQHDSNPTMLGEALNIVGAAYLYQGEYAQARPQFEQALTLARQAKDASNEIRLLNNLGNVDFFLGRYASTFALYQQAAQRWKGLEHTPWFHQRQRLTLTNLAVLHLQLGQNRRAMELYREALAIPVDASLASERAQILTNLAVAYRRLGDPYKALERHQEAQRLLAADPHAAASLYTLHNIGVVQALDIGDLDAALETFSRALVLAEKSGNKREAALEHLFLGETLLRKKHPTEARAEFQQALDAAQTLKATDEQWTALYGLGRAHALEGDPAKALELQQHALQIIESMRTSLGVSTLRAEFLADKRDVYDAVIGLLLDRGDPPAVIFRHIEQARARNLKDKTASAEVTLEAVQRNLPPKSALLEYWMTADRLAAVWIPAKGEARVVQTRGASSPAIEALAKALLSPKADWKTPSQQVSQLVLNPAWLLNPREIERLLIIPDGPLHAIPFETLQWGVRSVLEEFDVAYLPSAGFLKAAPQARGWSWPWQVQLVAFADPLPSSSEEGALFPPGPRLLRSAEEVRAVAKALPGAARLFIGADNLKRNLQTAPVMHFATHAAADVSDARRSRMQFTAEPGDPASQYLFANEIAQLDLHGVDLVTLAACESERGRNVGGEGPESLSRAFLGAGARASVSSLWRVSDAATEHLMSSFYRQLASGRTKAHALRQAKLEFVRGGAAPYYWAAFLLNGDGHEPLHGPMRWSQLGIFTFGFLALAVLLFFKSRK